MGRGRACVPTLPKAPKPLLSTGAMTRHAQTIRRFLEYEDEDRYAREMELEARKVTSLFSHAARSLPGPLAAELSGPEPQLAPLHEERKLRATRTMHALLRRCSCSRSAP